MALAATVAKFAAPAHVRMSKKTLLTVLNVAFCTATWNQVNV